MFRVLPCFQGRAAGRPPRRNGAAAPIYWRFSAARWPARETDSDITFHENRPLTMNEPQQAPANTCRRSVFAVVAFALGVACFSAGASTCDMLRSNVDDARTYLQRAARSSDLDDARNYARRARNALDDAASSARDCDCQSAYSEFDDAATKARRARDSGDADEFAGNLNRAIRSFNDAIDYLRSCARRR
ncbi:MAG TPA: hypothetical protein PKV98_09455 [Burkholderiaceae bacterium]|nr:hypothetical protein [Burkholderiaceae bacterium]